MYQLLELYKMENSDLTGEVRYRLSMFGKLILQVKSVIFVPFENKWHDASVAEMILSIDKNENIRYRNNIFGKLIVQVSYDLSYISSDELPYSDRHCLRWRDAKITDFKLH